MQYLTTLSLYEKSKSFSLLKNEMCRLGTFVKFPPTARKSPLLLAEDGFVYIGDGGKDNVQCIFCGMFKENWTTDADVQNVHAATSPDCPMVSGRGSDNIPWTSTAYPSPRSMIGYGNNFLPGNVPQDNNEILTDGPSEEPPSSIARSESGSTNSSVYSEEVVTTPYSVSGNIQEPIHTPSNTLNSDRLGSTASWAHSGSTINGGPESTTAAVDHSTNAVSNSGGPRPTASATQNITNNSSGPASYTNYNSSNGPATYNNSNRRTGPPPHNSSHGSGGPAPTYFDLGIVTERPKRIEYALKTKRLETFVSWPRDHHLTPSDLSNAGFYYAGYGDCSRCFFCGGGLRNWEDEDDVLVEHARWFPKCAYMRQRVGQRFIDVVQDLTKEFDQITLQMVMDKLPTLNIGNMQESTVKSDPAVQAVLELGYRETEVLDIAALLKEQSIPLSADVILERLAQGRNVVWHSMTNDSQQPDYTVQKDLETIRNIKQSNNELRQRIVCKICLDQEVAVAFLPCGHLVSCTECSIAMRDCPLCRTNVKGIVRAFLN